MTLILLIAAVLSLVPGRILGLGVGRHTSFKLQPSQGMISLEALRECISNFPDLFLLIF